MNKKIITKLVYLPDDLAFKRCLKIIKDSKNFDDGFVDWTIKSKKYGYTSGEAFTIISILTNLIYEIAPVANNMDKKYE